MEMENNIDIIIIKHLSNEASSEEEAILKQWLSDSANNQEEYNEMKELWSTVPSSASYTPIDVDNEWAKFKNENLSSKTKVISLWSSKAFKYAAILIIALFAGSIYFNSSKTYTSGDHKLVVNLNDGSTITLNTHTTLKVDRTFNWFSRNLNLDGEAFFEVAKNPSKAFTIHSSKTNVQVLGTSFNFNTNGESPSVQVKTGRVAFWSNTIKDTLILTKGMEGKMNDGEIKSSPIQDVNFQSWVTGDFEFDQTPLFLALPRIESYYEITLEIEEWGKLKNCFLNTHFKNEPLENVLDELQLLMGFETSNQHPKYILTNGYCN